MSYWGTDIHIPHELDGTIRSGPLSPGFFNKGGSYLCRDRCGCLHSVRVIRLLSLLMVS